MQLVNEQPMARRRLPAVRQGSRRRFDRGSFTPLVVGLDQLPRLLRSNHVLDVLGPGGEIAGEARSRIGSGPESWRDEEGVAGDVLLSRSWSILVPAVGLVGA